MVTEKESQEISLFTRREIPKEKLFSFSFILCDNEIDRDGEKFSDQALSEIAKRFVGVTGVFDHEATAKNQGARIYKAELLEDETKKTSLGESYKFVKATAYMVLNHETEPLAQEIDAGIKKEVSLCCSAERGLCSICGESSCGHILGEFYDGKRCYKIINEITDAYEWSFVAVPAQVGAGVIKSFSLDKTIREIKKAFKKDETRSAEKSLDTLEALAKIGEDYIKKLKGDAISFLVFNSPEIKLKQAKTISDALSYEELLEMEKGYEESCIKAYPKLRKESSKKENTNDRLGSFII